MSWFSISVHFRCSSSFRSQCPRFFKNPTPQTFLVLIVLLHYECKRDQIKQRWCPCSKCDWHQQAESFQILISECCSTVQGNFWPHSQNKITKNVKGQTLHGFLPSSQLKISIYKRPKKQLILGPTLLQCHRRAPSFFDMIVFLRK